MSERGNRACVAVALTLVSCFIHLRELLGERLYWRDTHIMYVPMKHFLAETLRGGELPQWWPYDGLGTPFLALPMMSTFHPTTLAYVLLPFWPAFALQNVAGSLIASFGTYLAARAMRLPRTASLIAATVFVANGYLVSLTEHTFMKLSVATMPWYVWALITAAKRGKAWWLGPSLVMALLLLGGDAQAAILASFAGLALIVAERERLRHSLAASLASPILGASLAAIQLLPSLGIVGETERASDVANSNQWALDGNDILALLVPNDLGPYRFARSMVIGIPVVVLVVASLSRIRQRQTMALWALLLIGLWLSAGDAFGLNLLAKQIVPLWSKFRYPIKASSLTMMAVALLSAHGFAAFVSTDTRARALQLGGVSVLGSVVVVLSFGVANSGGALWWVGAATTIVAIGGLATRQSLHVGLAAGLVIVFVVATGQQQLRTIDAKYYDPSPLVDVLRKEGVSLRGPAFERMDTRSFSGDELAFVHASGVGGKSVAAGARFHFPVTSFYAPGVSKRVLSFFSRENLHVEMGARLNGILGVGILIAPFELVSGSDLTILGREPNFDYTAVKLRRSLPRAYAAHRAVPVPDLDAAYLRMRSGPFKPGKEALIEGDVDASNETREDQLAVPVEIVTRTNASVTLAADLPWPGWVVLNEAAYEGWSAWVDGTPANSRIANGVVRAVEVPQGKHTVEWRFSTPNLALGAVVSAASMLGLLLAAVVLHRKGANPTTAARIQERE
jgi:hypothetical protein